MKAPDSITTNDFAHIVIDIETLGHTPGSAITSLSAVVVSQDHLTRRWQTGSHLTDHISLGSCREAGLGATHETILWWMAQSTEARRDLIEGQKDASPLDNALTDLANLIQRNTTSLPIPHHNTPAFFVWGNGANFDTVLLEAAYRAAGIPCPWMHWQVRCLRTLRSCFPHIPAPPFEGTRHNAAADALHEAQHLAHILNSIQQEGNV